MVKQTKLIKFMLFVLLLLPIVLFVIGVVQTFVIKSEQQKLFNAKKQLELKQKEYQDVSSQHNYIFKDKNSTNGELVLTDEYKKEIYKHNEYYNEEDINKENPKYYGDEGDTKIIIPNSN